MKNEITMPYSSQSSGGHVVTRKLSGYIGYASVLLLILALMLVMGSTNAAGIAVMPINKGGVKAKKSGGDYNNAVYEEELIDLEVKVLGGMVKHTRYLSGGVTQFNPNWASLNLEYTEDKEAFLPEILRRNRHEYKRQGETGTWIYDEQNYIVKTSSGFRWHNRKGDWIDYDDEGVTLGYGDRNQVKISFTRDADGHIEKVLDHNQTPVLTFHYAENGWLQRVTDSAEREVSYEYKLIEPADSGAKTLPPGTSFRGVIYGGRLIKVTDGLGETWHYEYSGTNNPLPHKRTDPDGQVLSINYGFLVEADPDLPLASGSSGSETIVCTNWVGESWQQGPDGWDVKIKCLSSSSSGGGSSIGSPDTGIVIETQNNPEDRIWPVIKSLGINGEVIRKYIYLYNKDKKHWIRGVEDGDGSLIVSRVNEEGELLELIRNGRSVEKTIIEGNTYTKVDENGNKTTIRKDSFENVVQETYADGSKITRTFNTQYSLPTSITDENGNLTQYEYDANGNLLKMIEAAGTAESIETVYAYDQYGQGTKITHADGRIEQWTYDDKGNVSQYTDGEGHVTQYADYDALGNPGKMTDGRGKITLYQYDNAGNLTQLTTPLGYKAKYAYDGRGNLTKLTDALNQETILTYDARNRLTNIRNPLGETTQLEYNSRGYITKIIDPANKTILRAEYDLDGNLVKQTDGNGNTITQDFGYLNLKPYKGLLNETQYPGYTRTLEYDTLNRPTRDTEQAAGETPRSRSYRYDLAGNLTRLTDPNGHISKLIYDAHHRVIKHEDRMQQSTQFGYDIHHNLNQVTNAKNEQIRRYEYNGRDELTKEILPDNSEYQLDYDANGNVIKQIDAKGQVSTYEYDDDNRLATSRYFDNEAESADNANAKKTVSYSYDELDRLTDYNDGTTQGSYSYDAADRLTTFTINYGSFSKTASYSYYPNGLKKSYTAPDGSTVTYGYDANNQLQTVSIPGQGSYVVNENQWLVPKTVTLPGGIKQNYSLDGYLRTTQIKSSKSTNGATTDLLDYQYDYDSADNVTALNIQQGINTGQRNYQYDAEERLTQITQPGSEGNTDTITLDYDAVGNRINDSRQPHIAGWEYDAQDRLIKRGDLNYSYDANGSLISISHETLNLQKTFIYDHENRLREVKAADDSTIATYQYDPFGRRISKTTNGTTTYYFYAQEGLIAEFDASGNVTTQYGYKPDSTWGTGPLYIQQNGTTGYYHNDHQGTPQKIVASSSTVLWEAGYTPFGQATITTETITNNLRLAGQYFDAETNLHYNYFRYYDPEIGRYITSDPTGLAGGINTYSYVYGNPLYWIDPLGLCGFDAWDLLMFVPVGGPAILASRLAFRAGSWAYKGWQARRKAKLFCSFDGSTLVATPSGYKEISNLEVGDLVYARDEKTGETAAKPVSHVFVEQHDDDVRLVTVESSDGETVITTSDEHPFYVKDKGWIRADELNIGYELISLEKDDDRLVVKNNQRLETSMQMYNLEVEDFHTYAVSEQKVWVHNECGGLAASIRWKGFSKGKLNSHYQKHVIKQKEFGDISQANYLKQAKMFAKESGNFSEAQVGNFIIKHDSVTGRVLVGHSKSRQIRTFYKNDGRDDDAFNAAVEYAQGL